MGVGRKREKPFSSFLPLFSFHSIILMYYSNHLHHTFYRVLRQLDFELMYLGNKKWDSRKKRKKVREENVKMEWIFRSRIPHSRPCFLLSQRSSILSIVLLMTNIDCKIVVFFSIKIVFFAKSMQAERDKKF